VWVRKSSIRPVPSFARIPHYALEHVRKELLGGGVGVHDGLDDAFKDFEEQQPVLASYVGQILSRSRNEATIALGFFLSLSIWLAFSRTHGAAVQMVAEEDLHSTLEHFILDENLRMDEPQDPLETVDVIAMEQPALVEFVHEHMDATLELKHTVVNPEELQLIYRNVLVEILALSYAVRAPLGTTVSNSEVLA
jgi:hypothetical protein